MRGAVGKAGATERRAAAPAGLLLVPMPDSVFARLSGFIQAECGIKLPPGKKTMLEARLRKRLRARELETFEEYCDFVFGPGGLEEELVHLLDVVTTNKTDFFRDEAQFRFLADTALPALLARGAARPLEIWSAGCSTGEEPWTIAMTCEEFRRGEPGLDYRILATDLSTRVLGAAARAVYREDRVGTIPPELRRRYLLRSSDRTRGLVRVAPELRARASFRRVNLRQPPYPVHRGLDIVFCRNVLIYFERDFQRQLLEEFVDRLAPGGYLFLGHTESIQGMGLPLESLGGSIHRRGG